MPVPPLADRDQLTHDVRALLGHLQRAGISCLPRPDADAARESLAALLGEQQGSGAPPALGSAPASPQAAAPARQAAASAETAAAPPPPPAAAAPAARSVPAERSPGEPAQPSVYQTPSLPAAARENQLAVLAEQVASCTRCEVLACSRKRTVFGEGNPTPRVCFLGEAPGADEDRQGRPFVGRAGQLLTKIIEACTFRRDEVYILNTLKCRPPANRNPSEEELASCREYFTTQLEILQPEYIVCLGLVAAKALLGTTESVGRLRGRLHAYQGSKVVVTYHPAYLLRNPSAKRATWDDMQMMMRDMGIRPPGKG